MYSLRVVRRGGSSPPIAASRKGARSNGCKMIMGRVGVMARGNPNKPPKKVGALLTTQGLPVLIQDVPTAKLVVVKPRWDRHPEAPTRPARCVWVGRAKHRDHPAGRRIVQAKRGRGVHALLVACDFAVGWQDRAPAVAGPCVFAVGWRRGWWTHDCCTGAGARGAGDTGHRVRMNYAGHRKVNQIQLVRSSRPISQSLCRRHTPLGRS